MFLFIDFSLKFDSIGKQILRIFVPATDSGACSALLSDPDSLPARQPVAR